MMKKIVLITGEIQNLPDTKECSVCLNGRMSLCGNDGEEVFYVCENCRTKETVPYARIENGD